MATGPRIRRGVKKAAVALVTAVAGSAAVFGLMLAMNGFNEAPEAPDDDGGREFDAAPEPEPPKKEPEPEPEPKESKPSETEAAPPPELGSEIGSVGIEPPGVDPGQMEDATEELLGDAKPSMMDSESVDEKPEPKRRVQPELPRRLVKEQVEGKVLAEALIDESGRVEQVRIKQAEPEGVFDEMVEEALKQWEFAPATYEGEPVKTWAEVPFHFELG